MLMPMGQLILEILAYGGGAATVAYLIFRFLGQSWIESKFAQSLANHKHEQDKEIQRLRVKIDSMLSGAIKLQDMEFRILPVAWEKLDKAYTLGLWLASPAQEYPNVGNMTDAELEEYFETSELRNTDKDILRGLKGDDRNIRYQELYYWYKLNTVNVALKDLHNYTAQNGIIFSSELKNKFKEIIETLNSVIAYCRTGHQHNDFELKGKGWPKLQGDGKRLYEDIEQEITNRLRSHSKGEVI